MSSESAKVFCYEFPRPALTVDIVLFLSTGNRVEVLLIKRAREPFKGLWALPGGFVDEEESLEDAAARELLEETGISGVHLEQFGAFGDPGRDPRGHTVSVVFYGLLRNRVPANAADDAAEVEWHSAFRPPKLAFDHEKILSMTLNRILPAGRKSET
jgi:8-oxo-dGTP diphosphatase